MKTRYLRTEGDDPLDILDNYDDIDKYYNEQCDKFQEIYHNAQDQKRQDIANRPMSPTKRDARKILLWKVAEKRPLRDKRGV
jgi:tRNA U38,U39,U40 pseudouridine synthase TruA